MAFRFVKTILLPLLWLYLSSWCAAQSVQLDVIDSDQGLSQGMIYDILQDRQGFLWFGTRDGLNRYDGYNFQVYKNDPFNLFSISDNVIKVVFEDHLGRIWVGTENNGVDVLDPASGQFYHLSKGANGLSNQNVLSLAETSDGAVWVGTENGLNRIFLPAVLPMHNSDLTTVAGSESYYWEKDDFGASIRNNVYHSLAVTTDGLLWVGTMQACYKFQPQTGIISTLPIQENTKLNAISKSNLITKALDGSIWVGQLNRIIHIKGDRSTVFPLPLSAGLNGSSLTFDRDSNLFVSRQKEIFYFSKTEISNFENGGITASAPSPQAFYSFPAKDVIGCSKILCDRRGLIWIGTNGYGIRKYNPVNRLFKHYLPGISTRKIRTGVEGEPWVWTSTGRFSMIEEKTNSAEKPLMVDQRLFQHDCLFTQGNILWVLAQERSGLEDNSLLIRKNLKTGAEETVKNLISAGIYSQLMEDKQGNIWILGVKSDLVKYDPKTKYSQKFDLSSLTGFKEYSFAIMQGFNGYIWIGTPHGLVRGIPEEISGKMNFTVFKNNPTDLNSLNNNAILSLLDDERDPSHYLWVGTRGGGLNLINKSTGKCQHFTPADGLPNDVIYGVLDDGEGCLWLSTNSGLSKLNPKTNYFENYSVADGLQDNEFNTISYAKTPTGTMIFGGVNGVTIFDPKLIKNVDSPPLARITALKVHSKLFSPSDGEVVYQNGQIWSVKLPYENNHLTLDFSAMDFSTPRKNQFRYRMVGAHDNWSEATNEHSITFSNLPSGKYTFEVKTGGPHGIWTGEPSMLTIIILPPWWRSDLAYVVYLLLLIWIGWVAYHFQVRRIQLQEQVAFEHREADRMRTLEQMKTSFFNNITHELRTPITLIVEPLRQIINDSTANNWLAKVRVAEGNSQKLLQIVNQLLDLAKLEGHAMYPEYQYGQVAIVLESIAEAFSDNANNKNITLTCRPEGPALKPFGFDADKLGKIATNLLSNALKFTPEGGTVNMSWRTAPENGFVLEVVNSGPGIDASDLPRVFDRFYSKANIPETLQISTGIGLALCRELAELMGGRMEAESSEGNGATFRLWLPMRAVSPKTSEPAADEEQPMVAAFLKETTHEAVGNVSDNASSNTRPLVLLAEDNAELRQFISETLSQRYQVLEASDGQEAAELAFESVPDIIVSDLMMPRVNGFGLLNILKNDIRTSHIPLLLLTAKTELGSRIEGIQHGADAYLGKPFESAELFAWIQNLLEGRHRLQERFRLEASTQGEAGAYSGHPAAGAATSEPEIGLLDRQFLENFKEIIEAEIDNDEISPVEIARRLSISRSQLHRKLSALTGHSVTEYLRNYRLDRAHELLKAGAGNVSEIAWRVGFVNAKHFSTAFKDRFGKSPSEV